MNKIIRKNYSQILIISKEIVESAKKLIARYTQKISTTLTKLWEE